MDVPEETPSSSKTTARMVPVSAEDFARARRRILFKWLGAGLILVLLGVLLYVRSASSGDAQKALDDGERMLKANKYTEAIQSLDRALSLRSGMVDAYLYRGRANAALLQLEPAVQDFTKVIQLRPQSTDALLERATAYAAQENYQAAIADCGLALSLDPKLVYGFTLRGNAYRKIGNLPRALDDFNRAVALSPVVDSYFQRASTYQLMGEQSKAIADLDEMITILPSSPMGYFARAKSRELMGDAAGARSDREQGRVLEERQSGQ
jgi:tetratricopeptide (TPR) repeat protein